MRNCRKLHNKKNILFSQIEALSVKSQQEIESEYQACYNQITEEFAKSKKIHEESLTALSFFWIYGKAIINAEKENITNVFGTSYKDAVTEETTRFASLVSEHDAVLKALSLDRDTKLVALAEFMDTQIQTVENQYAADIQAIDAAVKKVINEVNGELRSCIRRLDSSRKSMAINGLLIIGASCAVFAAPALLAATVGNVAAGAIQVSAATTGLGAANNLFNNNDAVGVSLTFNLSTYTPKPYVAPTYKAPSLQKDIVLPADNHLSGIELDLFSNNKLSGSYGNAYAVTQPKAKISFTNSENKPAAYNAPRIENKQIPINKTGAINWSRMAWRATNQDKSPEVISWQQNNRNRFPKAAAFFDSIANSKSQRLVNAFADEFAGRPVRFVEKELSLIKQRQKTQTAQFIANTAESLKHAKEFVVQDTGRFITGDTTKTEIFFEMVGNFIDAEVERLAEGQETVIWTAIAEDFKVLANMTPEQLGAHLGHEAGDAFLMYLGAGALQAGSRATTKAIGSVINLSKELKATHTFRAPLLFQFEEAKLYNGFPFDTIKVQKPIVGKVAETEVIAKDVVQGYAQGNKANLAYDGVKATINYINPKEVRFSQSTVSRTKVRYDDVTGERYTYTFDDIVSSMKINGWQGEPINVVRMHDGSLTAIDNTRLLAARNAGIEAKVKIHDYNAPIPKEVANNYYVEARPMPNTWGEAIHSRISVQKDVYFQDRIFTEKFPNGSSYDPKLTGRGP